jgi:hypothetical protein
VRHIDLESNYIAFSLTGKKVAIIERYHHLRLMPDWPLKVPRWVTDETPLCDAHFLLPDEYRADSSDEADALVFLERTWKKWRTGGGQPMKSWESVSLIFKDMHGDGFMRKGSHDISYEKQHEQQALVGVVIDEVDRFFAVEKTAIGK